MNFKELNQKQIDKLTTKGIHYYLAKIKGVFYGKTINLSTAKKNTRKMHTTNVGQIKCNHRQFKRNK